MFNFKDLAKQVAAAAAVGFGAAVAAALIGDVDGALAAAQGGYGAAVAVALGLIGNLVKQLIDRARGIVSRDSSELVEYLDAAGSMIAEAKKLA